MKACKNLIIVVLAAGKGKRMLSHTPKVLHRILDKPMIHYVLKEACKLNPSRVYVVTGFGHEELEKYLNENFPMAIPVFQEEQLGTGHAVNMVRKYYDSDWDDVMVLPGDSPLIKSKTLEKLIDSQHDKNLSCSLLSSIIEDPYGYGRIVKNEKDEVIRIVEERDAYDSEKKICEINSSIYCFKAAALFDYLKKLKTDNSQNEFYLTDIIEEMIKDGHKAAALKAEDALEALGVNDRLALSGVTKIMQRRINEELMKFSGVSMTDPESAYIGDEVVISRDVIIHPSTFIYGKSTIGSGCIIGPSAQLYDCHIGKNTVINSTVLIEAKLGENNNVGPFTYVRPGTVTDDKVKIGGFCEVKKSKIGRSSKIPHLTYIGDTEIGQNVNIGASSVTCNYDSFRKNRTIIGNDVFIGSDTMLVPPVEIGNGAIVAAGSVITENVPEDALAIARSKQVNIEGGAVKFRAKKEKEKNEGACK
jgi:bifunctional UDP-N-acetylglucosamine pyrophosphorylase/glucosamine-1-phosphate N-acetyltransferase